MTKDTAADSALTNGGAEDQNDDKNPADVVAASAESREDVESRHRKELKQLDGEKRAALKKAKGTKGKKAKEELTRTEAEFETKLVEMQNRHASELSAACQTEKVGEEATSGAVEKASKNGPNSVSDDNAQAQAQATQKLERLRLKKEAEREQRLAAEQALKDELNALGPSRRDLEVQAILSVLEPLGYTLQHVAADGNCLYRSIAGQVQQQSNDPSCTYTKIRSLCADTLAAHSTDFAPFCVYNDDDNDLDEDAKFARYVEAVRNSSEWGGHLEVRVLSLALNRPIFIYSSNTATSANREPLVIDGRHTEESTLNDNVNDDTDPIRLSYHLHYYALGEHYNMVVTAATANAAS